MLLEKRLPAPRLAWKISRTQCSAQFCRQPNRQTLLSLGYPPAVFRRAPFLAIARRCVRGAVTAPGIHRSARSRNSPAKSTPAPEAFRCAPPNAPGFDSHSAEPYGYPNPPQRAGRSGKPRGPGSFLPESSVIVPIEECPVLSPRLAHTFAQLQEMARAGRLPEGIQEIEAFADSADDKIALNIAFEKFSKPAAELAASFREALPQIESLLLLDQRKNRFELTGPGYLTHEAGGHKFRVSHLSFFQVNRFLIEDLLKTVTAKAHGALALDLYSGVGFFTLPLAKSFQRVVSVDANLAATRDLYANAEMAGVTIVSHNEHAEEFLKKTDEKPEFVVLHPPRAGLGAQAAEKLAELGAREIGYLSCDPSTLARDLAVLTSSLRKPKEIIGPSIRYEITEMHLFDLFPQTFHIETLVRLRRVP